MTFLQHICDKDLLHVKHVSGRVLYPAVGPCCPVPSPPSGRVRLAVAPLLPARWRGRQRLGRGPSPPASPRSWPWCTPAGRGSACSPTTAGGSGRRTEGGRCCGRGPSQSGGRWRLWRLGKKDTIQTLTSNLNLNQENNPYILIGLIMSYDRLYTQ